MRNHSLSDPTPVSPRGPRDLVLPGVLSFILHILAAGTLILMTIRVVDCRPAGGNDGNDRLNGQLGGGGPTVEISVEGPAVPTPAPAEPSPPEPPSEPEPVTPPAAQPPHATHAATEPASSGGELVTGSKPRRQPATPRHATTSGGTGARITSGGSRRPGSVGQQRSLLPRAMACEDPVAGIWRAHKYDPLYGDWFLATLRIRREQDNTLQGAIVVRQWEGGPLDNHPPICGPDGFDFTVEQPGQGFIRGQYVDFGAHSYRLRGFHCNPMLRLFGYNPDHFTGTIDPELQEFQSVNNDGGRSINDPMVFRRVGCLDGTEIPLADQPQGL